VDRGALDAALAQGFPCGGYCPPGRLAEDGHIPDRYPLSELPEGGYLERTIRNVIESDGTVVLYFGTLEGGTAETVRQCEHHRKPYLLSDGQQSHEEAAATALWEFVRDCQIQVLNVAGPRQSRAPRAQAYAERVITGLIWRTRTPSD
jgi:putative molybdenum carrier protein